MTSISEVLKVMRRKKEQGINLSYKGTWCLMCDHLKIQLQKKVCFKMLSWKCSLYPLMHPLHTRVHKPRNCFLHLVWGYIDDEKEYEQ